MNISSTISKGFNKKTNSEITLFKESSSSSSESEVEKNDEKERKKKKSKTKKASRKRKSKKTKEKREKKEKKNKETVNDTVNSPAPSGQAVPVQSDGILNTTQEKIAEFVKGNDVLNSTKNNLDELPKEPEKEEGKKSAENSVDEVRFLLL